MPDRMTPMIDAEEVGRVFRDCLHRDGESTDDAVVCQGVTCTVGLQLGRLRENAERIHAWLDALPASFHAGSGDGYSFLNACDDRAGVQWTGLHLRVQELVQLGIGLGRVAYVLPREIWQALPGGMPYFVIKPRAAAA